MGSSWDKLFLRTGNGYQFAVAGIAAVTVALAPFHERFSSTTVALALLLVVLFAATGWGSRPALLAAILGGICFNFFFLPPVHTFVIAAPQNWTALAAFLITAFTAGQLSARAKRRAEEAEAGKIEIERLYREYQVASEQAKQAEVFRQGEQLKSALLDAVTHDLRTPLTSIKASVTTLLAEESGDDPVVLDPEGRSELLDVINEEADRLNRFVENMVELARLEAGELRLRRRWGAVEEIIASALERASDLTSGHRVELSIESELPSVRVDATLLAEVLFSLIDNAAKYSPAGSHIRITAKRANEDEMILITITDEGRGVPYELRERVFDKFFRAANVTTGEASASLEHPKGLGMGLAIARGIVEAHGGRIWLEGAEGKVGSCVKLLIPVGDEEAVETEQKVKPAMSEAQRILVVDDETQITRVLRRSLSARGYEVQTANDGEEALKVFAQWPADLVVTDLSMQQMGGLELCRRLRKLTQAPIIVLSVKGEERTKVEALDAGADDYVTKPFGIGELLARIRAALRRAPVSATLELTEIKLGDFYVDLEGRTVTVHSQEVRLTPKEYELLVYLIRHSGKVLTHRVLLGAIWGGDYVEQTEYLRVFIGQLRKKIEPDSAKPRYILTEPWVGYRFNPGS